VASAAWNSTPVAAALHCRLPSSGPARGVPSPRGQRHPGRVCLRQPGGLVLETRQPLSGRAWASCSSGVSALRSARAVPQPLTHRPEDPSQLGSVAPSPLGWLWGSSALPLGPAGAGAASRPFPLQGSNFPQAGQDPTSKHRAEKNFQVTNAIFDFKAGANATGKD